MAVSARVSSYLAACAAILAAASLSSCVPVVLGGAAATGGYVAGQERGVGTIASDTDIRAGINDQWYRYNSDMASQLSLSVYEGRVLVTGLVSNPEWKPEAVRLAWQVKGVKEVNDEIQVSDKSSIGDAASDEWIKTRLRSAILFDGDVRSLNYSIDVVNGVVYLSGSARTQAELDKVVDYARNIANVKRVVNYVRIRPGEPGAATPVAQGAPAPVAQPASTSPMSMSPASMSPASNAPASTGPTSLTPAGSTPSGSGTGKIEVTPLQ